MARSCSTDVLKTNIDEDVLHNMIGRHGLVALEPPLSTGVQGATECLRKAPMMRAEALTLTVNAKKDPKSCVAGILVMNNPGMVL